MGMLINGEWSDDDGDSRGTGGKFDHLPTSFRYSITNDINTRFRPDFGRYYLYVTKTCPWAHRTLIFRHLKGLKKSISVIYANDGEQGYRLDSKGRHVIPGTDYNAIYLHELYTITNPTYTGRVTVPTLWDSKEKAIVNNESSDIIRMFNSEFSEFTNNDYDYYPKQQRDKIDKFNELVYDSINNGVYKAGFSSNQKAYEDAYDKLFAALDTLEVVLSNSRFLCGEKITEADWRLFPTLFRFDTIYHYAFKCNKKHLYEYENLWPYTRDLFQQPGISEWCFLDHAKTGYWSGKKINPLGTIPKGPELDFYQKHERDLLT